MIGFHGKPYFSDDDMARLALSDCGWWDEPVSKRPFWAKGDCSGRMTDTEVGSLCEHHFNAMPRDSK